MEHRTVVLHWLPRSQTGWQTFTAARQEAARLWNDMVVRHARIRRWRLPWPTQRRWERWAKRKYPGLSAQSVQQTIAEFCEAVNSTRQLRKNGHAEARYPWRRFHYRDVTYTNQDARIRGSDLVLPNGQSGTLRIRIPDGVTLPGRMMEIHLCYGRVLIVCEVPDAERSAETTIGVDLGVNTLIAATDGDRAIVISGREAKATVQWRNKRLASLQQKQAGMVKGSRRWKRLQRRKYALLDKAHNRVTDLTHKATALVKQAFPDAQAFVGEPFNDAAQKCGRRQAQQVSQAANARLIEQINYKLAGAIVVPEPYSSQTCPVCGRRQRCRRTYHCPQCSYTAPRDVVGATNILRIGVHGRLRSDPHVPVQITYLRPRCRSSSGGHPASSSPRREAARLYTPSLGY